MQSICLGIIIVIITFITFECSLVNIFGKLLKKRVHVTKKKRREKRHNNKNNDTNIVCVSYYNEMENI